MSTYKEIFGKPIKVLAGDPAPTPVSFTVTASGGAFYIDGVLQKTLELYEGNTYIFTYPSAHPFRFATAADAAGSTEYTTGVTVDSSTQITIVVASGAPTLFYYCTNHSGMGGTILTPANISEYEGQIWYNESTGKFRSIVATAAWSSSSPLSTARYGSVAAGNTQNAALVSAGTIAGPYAGSTLTEEYNGSGWTGGGAYPTAGAGLRGCGTLTAALGVTTSVTNYYNGTAWTAQPSPAHNLPTTKSGIGMCGTQTAAVAFGGYVPGPNTRTNATEEYDGEGWTATNTMPTSVSGPQGFGIQTAAVSAGGDLGPANTTANAEYNGTSWTAATAVPVAIKDGFACGTQTAGMLASGAGPSPADAVSTNFLSYDGTSWTTIPSMATSRRDNLGGSNGAPNISTVQGGGNNPPTASIANTEEFTQSVNVITAAAFASGGVYPAQYYGLGSSTNGTQNAALGFAGNYPGGYTGNTTANEYNGSSWTAQPAMSTARAYLAGFGTSTAAVGVGGLVPPGATGSNAVEEFTGSWTAGNTIPQAGWNQGACGTLTAGFVAFGTNPAYPGQYAKAFEYDGTNWTAANDAPTATNDSKGMGVQTSALFAGGGPPSAEAKQSYEYDGTNWTAGGTLLVDHKAGVTLGSSKDAGIIGGGHTSPQTAVEGYDGTAWSTRPSMATSRGRGGMSGTESAGVVFGGNPSATNATEEWTGETSVLNTKNISTS